MKRWIVRWMSWFCVLASVGCAVEGGDRESRDGSPLSTSPPNCDRWRLFLAGDGLSRVEHPASAPPVELLGGSFVDVAAAGDALYASLEGGIWRAPRGAPDEGAMRVAAGSFSGASALAYDGGSERLYLAADLGLFALEPRGEDVGLSILHLAWPGFDALALDPAGGLFASSWDGAASTILYFRPPIGPFAQPEIAFWSQAWGAISDLSYGIDGSLYLTDGGPTVYVVDNPAMQNGSVEPTKTITFEGAALSGILVAPDGVGYLVDEAAGEVIAVDNLSDAYPWASPSWTIPQRGVDRLALLPPCDTP